MSTRFEPPHLREVVEALQYKPGWEFFLGWRAGEVEDAADNLQFIIVSETINSFDFTERNYRVRHVFMVPPATYNKNNWIAWLFDKIQAVENHEAGEFFRVDGLRVFAPHHGNGEDPYRIWFSSNWETGHKSSGED